MLPAPSRLRNARAMCNLIARLIGATRNLRSTAIETRTKPSTTIAADHAIPLNDSVQKCDTMPMVPTVKNAQAQ